MFSRAVRQCLLDTRCTASMLPPTFLLPLRARAFNSTTPIVEGSSVPTLHGAAPSSNDTTIFQTTTPPSMSSSTSISPSSSTPQPPRSEASPSSSHPASTSASQPASIPHDSLRTLLPLLKAQRHHYITVHIHARPYLVTEGDTLRLPFHMPGVLPGDILRLNRASIIGSRDYTMKGAPYLDENLFECRARVMGVESEPMRVILRTKPRQRRVKQIKSKHRYTVLKLAELRIKDLNELGW